MVKSLLHRTQLHLDEGRYRYLSSRAKAEGKSIAQVVRDLIDADSRRRVSRRKKDSLSRIIGIFSGGADNVSERVSDYLYGKK